MSGLDPNAEWLDYARQYSPQLNWVEGDARKLPFEDSSFDHAVSITVLCFVDDWQDALREMVRIARRIVLGLLNHNSLLYRQKGLAEAALIGARPSTQQTKYVPHWSR